MADYTRQINTEVTFTPLDNTIINHIWKINGIQESTSQIFKKTFTITGTYTITLEGSNSCGNCAPKSSTIEIVETPPLKWKCSGSPNYTCNQSTEGTYNTESECKTVCKETPPSSKFGMGMIVIAIGIGTLYTLTKKT